MRRLPIILVLAILLLVGVGCSKKDNSETQSASGSLKIAVIPKGTIHEFWKTVHAGADKAGKELGVEIIWKGPLKEDDRDAQISVVEDFISKGVSGIVLAPLDDTALRAPVANAQSNGIPVVLFDSGMKGTAGKDFVSFVATDNYLGGQLAGEYLAKILNEKGNVIVLRYNEGSDSTTKREDGFLDAVKKSPGIKILTSDQYAGVTTETAYKAGENLLSRFKGQKIDGIFCACEPVAFGMLRALQDANLAGKVNLVGFDSSEVMLKSIQNGQVKAIVVQNPMQIGYMGVKTLVQHLKNEKVPERIDTGATLITKDNMSTPEIQSLLNPLEKAK